MGRMQANPSEQNRSEHETSFVFPRKTVRCYSQLSTRHATTRCMSDHENMLRSYAQWCAYGVRGMDCCKMYLACKEDQNAFVLLNLNIS